MLISYLIWFTFDILFYLSHVPAVAKKVTYRKFICLRNNTNIFRSPENVLGMPVSQKSTDKNKAIADLVNEEALWK